jgi:hypothetical protein
MGDFVSQGTIDEGLTPVPDALGHDATALAILHKAVFLPPGAVIAVQGSWGRGKTDVLTRVATFVRDPDKHGIPQGLLADALWINPWQYGTPDLLTPLVLAMLARIPEEPRRNDKRLRKIAETLLRAGLNFGLKAVGTAAGVPILSLAADPVDRMVSGLFDAAGLKAQSDAPDPDPVSVMGERFRELAQRLLQTRKLQDDARLLVCVDDLDRCLPDRQVALLEAIRFLISQGAPVTFLIALDPTLARQAIVTHYRTDAFDPDRYLDKMFDLRVNLASLGARVEDLVKHHLGREMRALGHVMTIADAVRSLLLSLQNTDAAALFQQAAVLALKTPDLANPRVVRRIFDRLYLLAVSRAAAKMHPLSLANAGECAQLLLWLGIAERFPAIRAAVQAAAGLDSFEQRLTRIQRAYTADAAGALPAAASAAAAAAATSAPGVKHPLDTVLAEYRLPPLSAAPDLGTVFTTLQTKDGNWAGRIRDLDDALVLAGL